MVSDHSAREIMRRALLWSYSMRLQLRASRPPRQLQDFLAGALEVRGDSPECGISFLYGLGDLRVKGADAIAQFVDQLRARSVTGAFQ